MYAKASPFSLALAMLVQDQVLSLLMISELKFLQKKKKAKIKTRHITASSCLMLAMALESVYFLVILYALVLELENGNWELGGI